MVDFERSTNALTQTSPELPYCEACNPWWKEKAQAVPFLARSYVLVRPVERVFCRIRAVKNSDVDSSMPFKMWCNDCASVSAASGCC